jgi:hypothetical protein
LRLAGNDVVDLGDPANASPHARFVERVFAESERAAIAGSRDPSLLTWSFFAAKEAAFKVACKMGPRPVFAHRRFVVDPSLGSVRFADLTLRLRIEREQDCLHALAWTEGECPFGIATAVDRGHDLGIAARRLVATSLARRLRCSPAMLAIVRDPAPEAWDSLGPPRLLRYGVPVPFDVSLSHDGRFVAFAACLAETGTARNVAE